MSEQDQYDALVDANRDAILNIYQQASTRALDAIDQGKPEYARRILVAARGFHPMYDFEWPKEEQRTCGEVVSDMIKNAPSCPKHPDTKMTYADGMSPYHDLKKPHWRCELWVGSGVCGAIKLINQVEDSNAPK